ncbi:Hypothetical protein Eab7_1400 [Exiguobacterium antarcticum B7]|nr:Hypothetical protein Eab7_1400 [Exiguobacterium antarcticum B7]
MSDVSTQPIVIRMNEPSFIEPVVSFFYCQRMIGGTADA